MVRIVNDPGFGICLIRKEHVGSYYLMHHGVKGQKRGFRRWQNEDGSYTPEGYQHYKEMYGWGDGKKKSEQTFQLTMNDVRTELVNEPTVIKKKAVDYTSVKRRSGLNDSDVRKCVQIANKAFDRAAKAEPKITQDVISAVGKTNANMFGLENRLKQPTSIAGKIGSDAVKDGISFQEASNSLKDLVRYTAVSDENQFVKNYNQIKSELENAGYTETRCRNYFTQYAEGKVQHKSVQSVFVDSNGNSFEMQFQTVASQAAKELKLPLYEKIRSDGVDSKTKTLLEKQMHDLAEKVANPLDISSIQEHDSSTSKLSHSTYLDAKKRMSGEHGYVRPHHKERCQQILEKLGQPSIEKLNELKRLEKDANLGEVRESINYPPDEEWITVDGQLVGDYGRNYNCPNCACAFELVERGYDVTARRAIDGSNVGDISKYFVDGHFASDGNTTWTDDDIRFATRPTNRRDRKMFDRKLSKYYDDLNRTRDKVIDQFEQSIKSEGAGARGIVVVGWLSNESTKPTTCFHALNYKLEDGVVILYDTQDYDMASGCSTRYLGNFDPRELYHMRTDNLDLDESITQTVYSSGRGSK